jgi:hypothetical protein
MSPCSKLCLLALNYVSYTPHFVLLLSSKFCVSPPLICMPHFALNSFSLVSKHVSHCARNSVSFFSKSVYHYGALNSVSLFPKLSPYALNSVSLCSNYVSRYCNLLFQNFSPHTTLHNDLRRRRALKRLQKVDIFVRFYQNLDLSTEFSQTPDYYAIHLPDAEVLRADKQTDWYFKADRRPFATSSECNA